MNSKKYILIITVVLITIITILFLSISIQDRSALNSTKKEIAGLKNITDIHNLNITLKSIRGLNQLEKSQIASLKQRLFISDEEVFKSIKNLEDNTIEEEYKKLISSKDLTNEESFKQYTYLLKLLDKKRFDIADSSHLLFENDREIYFLMTIAVLSIPDSIENIGRIRAIGAKTLSNNLVTQKDEFLLQTNMQVFLNHIDEVQFILSKLSSKDSTKLKVQLNSILREFYDLDNVIKSIKNNTAIISPQNYFLQATKLVNNINNLFIASTDMLNVKLEKRKDFLDNKFIVSAILYALLFLIITITAYINYNRISRDKLLLEKKKNNNNFKNLLTEEYSNNLTLKEICSKSLSSIINHFNALNGSIYLFDKENDKLYLGSTYGIKKDSLKQTLDLHENTISENILERKIKVTEINQEISLGNVNVRATKIVTIPILEFESSIGTVQLVFNDKFKDVDIEFLQEIISLIASYIFKAQKDDEAIRYLKLIDTNILISKTDLDGNIIEASKELCDFTQYSIDELIGQNHRIFRHKETPRKIFKDMWSRITKGQTWRGELKGIKKDGSIYWLKAVISPDMDINGNIIGYTGIRTDITNHKAIEEIAITDGLTNIFNRRHFDDIFPNQIKINQREKGILAFLLIDIDHFKQYNDTYGHQEGDTALKLVASALKDTLRRPNDYTFRLGGEEFGLLYHIKNIDDGLLIANKARINIENLKIEHKGNSASKYVTISSGLYIIDADNETTVKGIYKKADEALYKAKHSGRNKVCIA